VLDAVIPVFFIQMDNNLRIAPCVKLVPTGLEIASHTLKVVNFSVKNNPDTPVFIVNGLVPAGNIDDAQSSHRKPHVLVDVHAVVIGAAMIQ
jgi:hypothetical protein